MSTSELITSISEDRDIDIFTAADDMFSPDCRLSEFNQRRFSDQLELSAQRARVVGEAQAQLMLARYQADSPDEEITFQERAEAMAFDLGRSEFNGLSTPANPFDDAALATAWDNGYSYSARLGKPQAQLNLERKFWEQGIDPDSDTSQFELAAIALYNLSLRTTDPQVADRCRRLACEMMSYDHSNPPSARRQRELNLFMARQSERMVQSIDVNVVF